MNVKPFQFEKSMVLFKRAASVIPGGIYGTKSPGFVVPGSYPYFFVRGEGSRLWDCDGNEYIDFLCGYGSQILGYGNSAVDDPAIRQLRSGDLLDQPSPAMVTLAEELVSRIRGMGWAVFAKNGTDVTTLAVSMARVRTGKRAILAARGAYHGSANWCSSNLFPILGEQEDVYEFTYGNIAELERLFTERDVACVILTPYHHPAFGPSILPPADWYPTVERLCRKHGALFIMDDIRANFRLHRSGSHAFFGASPDLIAMGKCLANGYPISVLMGTEEHRKPASSFFITGTFWMSAVPMEAALACLAEMDRIGSIELLERTGRDFAAGIAEAGRRAGFEVEFSGPPAIPFMTFKDDQDLWMNQIFCAEMTMRGIYLHPHHNWFMSCAHTRSDIERTVETAEECFRILARRIE